MNLLQHNRISNFSKIDVILWYKEGGGTVYEITSRLAHHVPFHYYSFPFRRFMNN
jgi:hypothetical protein